METSPPTATAAIFTPTATATVKTPEAETEAPPRIHQLNGGNNSKPLGFTNGVLKRHLPIVHHHHHNPPPVVITYKECLKNHAASLGAHAVDGCGEFMPSPASNPTDPTSLKCAACGCHRNFHRREPDDAPQLPSGSSGQQVIEYQPLHRHHPPPPPPALPRSPNSASPPPISSSYYPSAPHMLLALSTGVAGHPVENSPGGGGNLGNSTGRKRFRTKFTAEQKARMQEIAERIGWKMQKREEDLINEFCNEIGIEKVVFKVWMHNNKNTLGKRDGSSSATNAAVNNHHSATVVITNGNNSGNTSGGGSRSSPEETATTHFHLHHHHRDDHHHISHHLHHQNGAATTTNGSSSSS